jgi:predicted DCC family thiol-disulfide oxidoreductase YuxK
MDQPLYEACATAVHSVGPDGRVLGGADAVFYALERMGGGLFARVFRLPPLVWLMRGLYRLVANNRDKLSQLGFTQGEACGLKRSTGAPDKDA